MTIQTSGRVMVVRKEEKESKLIEFLKHHIDSRSAVDAGAPGYLLLARSPESPVARAMLSLKSELAAAGVTLKVIFSSADPHSVEACRAWAALLGAPVRMLKGAGFLEGHEQLVLGPHSAWIGDCMRRDPSKRDAFELYASDCAKTSGTALISFTRLWSAASCLPAPELGSEITPDVAAAAMPQDETKPLVSSRH